MKLTESEIDILIRQMLNIGEGMYCVGGEISRIEETLHRIGKAYGAEHVNVYTITSVIVLTLEFPGEPAITQSRRTQRRDSTNLSVLQEFAQLSRDIAKEPLPVEVLRERVLSILKEKGSNAKIFIGEVIAVAGFTLFFGGNAVDALASVAALGFIILLQRYFQSLCKSQVFFNIVAAFTCGVTVLALGRALPMLHTDKIMIGDIMALIPGIAITNSIRYTISGDTISGFEKLIDSMLQACGIAVGFMLAISLLGG